MTLQITAVRCYDVHIESGLAGWDREMRARARAGQGRRRVALRGQPANGPRSRSLGEVTDKGKKAVDTRRGRKDEGG